MSSLKNNKLPFWYHQKCIINHSICRLHLPNSLWLQFSLASKWINDHHCFWQCIWSYTKTTTITKFDGFSLKFSCIKSLSCQVHCYDSKGHFISEWRGIYISLQNFVIVKTKLIKKSYYLCSQNGRVLLRLSNQSIYECANLSV